MSKDFPRGGKRHHELQAEKEDADLFKTAESVPKIKSKAKSRKVKVAKRVKHTNVETLNVQTLREGMRVFGRVKDVQEFKVMVSLPHGMLGTLNVTAVSTTYTQLLRDIAGAGDDEDVGVIPVLKDLFKIGDGILCCVSSISTKGTKRYVELSTDPADINKDIPLSALRPGCVLYGSICSIEDHGYKMDLGIPGIQAFLAKSASTEQDCVLCVGKGVWCRMMTTEVSLEVLTGETRVIRVTMEDILQAEVNPQTLTSLDCLHPGMKVTATVEKVTKSGLFVKCIKYKGSVYRSHVPEALKTYSAGQEVKGRVLYLHPATKMVSLSLLPGVMDSVLQQEVPFGGLAISDIIEEAEVVSIDKGNGVFFTLGELNALAPLHHLTDKKIKDVDKAFPKGSKHKCRVIGFQPADEIVLVTLKESILTQKILSINDIQPGQIVEGEVEVVTERGVLVKLGKGLTGLIPKLHVADVPLKNFSKKFNKGDKVKCRVLKVDTQSRKVYLSKKKSLLSTSKVIPASYYGLEPHMQLEGYVIVVKDNGVVIGFCNDVKGWVPKSELSTEEIAHPETAFYQGQVLRCRVIFCHPDIQKLRLSLIISGKPAIASKVEKMEDFEAGKLLAAKVTKKLQKSLEVQLLPSGTKALLPREHLSDSAENLLLLWRSLQPGDSLDCVMLLKQTNVTIVTLKESFLSAAREGIIPKSIEDLQVGQMLPGVIRNHQSYGIFVELPGGLGGLAPHKLTMDHPTTDLTQVFHSGQTVVVKVVEVKEDKCRFLCSLRMCDCFHDDISVSLVMLETYLNERDNYLTAMLDEKAETLKVGSLIKVKVTKKMDDGYICETTFGMPAIMSKHHCGEDEIQPGMEVETVVLHIAVDEDDICLELSADRQLVRNVSRRAEKPHMDKGRPGQVVKGQVLLIKDDFVLVALKQHAVGSFAWLPRRQHPNDVLARTTSNMAVGDEVKVAIKKVKGDTVLAVPSSVNKEVENHPKHTLQFGQTVSAKIHTILPGQMNVRIGKISGRVHVTEVLDQVKNGVYPFSGYKSGQSVETKIIGFRHCKSFKYLPISHPRIFKALPECTLKQSKFEADGCPEEMQASHKPTYKPGDKVNAYVVKFEGNKLWVNVSPTESGVISLFDLSRDLGVLKHAEKNFPPGHGYQATVMGVEEGGLLHLSLTGKKEAVKKNHVVTGKVTSVSTKGLALWLPGDWRGMVPAWDDERCHKLWSTVTIGSFVRCLVLCCKHKEKCLLSLKLHHRSEDDLIKARKRRLSETETESPSPSKKKKKTLSESMDTESDEEDASSSEDKHPEVSTEDKPVVTETVEQAEDAGKCLEVSGGFFGEPETSTPTDRQDSEDSDDDSEEEEVIKSPKKKKRKKSESKDNPVEETSVTAGQSDVFEKELLANPNQSKLWIQYMCTLAGEGRVEKAKGVAEQALKTISFQEEQERLNVWLALLNLENLYGQSEDVWKTLQRALQVTDPLTLYHRVSAMFTASGKMGDAEKIHQILLRKFKQNRQVWADYALFLFKQGRCKEARNLQDRALLSLDRKDHIPTITQFAKLEFKHGEPEKGTTMFETIITEFPKRTDVMSVYIDMMVSKGDLDRARELFERALALKNTTFFFKKYLQFEEKHGTAESLAQLQARIKEES